jgi:hypothetical protein
MLRKITLVLLSLIVLGCMDQGGREVPGVSGNVPVPAFIGPVGDAGIQGHAMWDSWYDIAELGYVEEEYFVSGTARAYPEGEDAAYTTRIIMRRPATAQQFNGTVILDWVNVTAQFENAVDTLEAHRFFLREVCPILATTTPSTSFLRLPKV